MTSYNISKEQEKYDQIVDKQFKWASKKDAVKSPAREARYQRIFEILKRVAKKYPHKNLRILDLGCGNGETTLEIAKMLPHSTVEGVDISNLAIRYARECHSKNNITYFASGVEDKDYLDKRKNYFDIVVFNGALEHIKNDFSALKYIYDLCSDNADVIILTVSYKKYWSDIDTLAGHYRRYEPKQLRNLVRKAGFELKEEIITGFPFSLLFYLIQASRTNGTQMIYRPEGLNTKIFSLASPLLYMLMKMDKLFDFTRKGHLIIVRLKKQESFARIA